VDEEAALKILVIYNQVHLPPKDGLELFLAVLNHPLFSNRKEFVCWQQLARAYAQLDYEHNVAFRLFSSTGLIYETMAVDAQSWADKTKSLRAEIDEKRFDVSACK